MPAEAPTPEPCYILHRRPFRESSLIVDVVAPGRGLLGVILKGAQASSKGKSAALAQPFRPLLMAMRGGGEMKTAYTLEENGPVIPLTDKYLYSGFYVNELICRLWPKNIESDELFDLYADTLQGLLHCQQGESGDNIALEQVLRSFELTLLNLLGFAIDFCYTADDNNEILPKGYYQFNPGMGFTEVDIEIPNQQLSGLFLGTDILAIGALDFSAPRTLKAAKSLTRRALAAQLGPKPLKSRELFTSMR